MNEELLFKAHEIGSQRVVLGRDLDGPEDEPRLWRVTNWGPSEINQARSMYGAVAEYRIATIFMEEC